MNENYVNLIKNKSLYINRKRKLEEKWMLYEEPEQKQMTISSTKCIPIWSFRSEIKFDFEPNTK